MAENGKTGVAIKDLWYNNPPSPSNIPFLGMEGKERKQVVSNVKFQQFLTAANKRLIKNWMGILKCLSTAATDADEQKLYDWFGQADGRRHFRGWCEQLGTQPGDRQTIKKKSAHDKGKAMDINYGYNPWCPVCTHSAAGATETFKMIGELTNQGKTSIEAGEKVDYQRILNRCGRVYDRCLRMFVPIVTGTGDDHGMKHFARRYFRNNCDWVVTDSATGLPPFSPDQIYKQYQILNWSIRFYFHYVYGQIAEFRKKYSEGSSTLAEPVDKANSNSTHSASSVKTGKELWAKIKNAITAFDLPPESEILIDKALLEKYVTDATQRSELFELLDVRYPFEPSNRQVYRFSLSKTKADTITEPNEEAVGKAILEQIKDDHHALSLGMLYTYPGSRDPCNGVFNFSYETILALCYLLSSNKKCRMFGAFATEEAGDMQHFDYGHESRP